MVLQSFLPECQIAAAGTAWPRTSLRRGWNSVITDFPDSKQISRICSVRARDSTPDEPGRSFFGNNPGKLLAPDRDWCARHQEHRPGSWSAAAYALRKIREIGFQIRGIRDEAVARFLVIQPVKPSSVAGCMHWLRGGPRTWTLYRLARISQSMSISPSLVRRVDQPASIG